MEFYITFEKGYEAPYFVKEKKSGWFFPLPTERQAVDLCDYLNELIQPKKPTTIAEYYTEWENLITELETKTQELNETITENYKAELEIITTFDFKEKYGKDNERIRKLHIKEELAEIFEKRHELEQQTEYIRRRIEFIQSIVQAKLHTVYGVGE